MRRRILISGLASMLIACAGTDTGNPFDGPGPVPGGLDGVGDCPGRAHAMDGIDAQTPLGFSGADVLAISEGRRAITMKWETHPDLGYGPEAGDSELTIDISYDGGRVLYVEPAPDAPSDAPAPECAGRVDVMVQVHVRTAGGALDEAFEARLQGYRAATPAETPALAATLHGAWALDALHGSFGVESLGEAFADHEVSELTLQSQFGEPGVRGELSLRVTGNDRQATRTWVRVARWPAEE